MGILMDFRYVCVVDQAPVCWGGGGVGLMAFINKQLLSVQIIKWQQ